MTGKPDRSEAAEYHFGYIDKVASNDILPYLDQQTEELLGLFAGINEEQSQSRYEPGKWTLREALGHINDTERVFCFRCFWIARAGGESPLPGFDQDVFAAHAGSDARSWASHVEEFRVIRASTMAMLKSLPAEAWSRAGTVSDYRITVRALAYMVAGHAEHHRRILVEKYL